jgi:hypothetical protein
MVHACSAFPPVNCQYRNRGLMGFIEPTCRCQDASDVNERIEPVTVANQTGAYLARNTAAQAGALGGYSKEERQMFIREAKRHGLALLLAYSVASFFPAIGNAARAEIPKEAAISEEVSAALARMSGTLRTKQFSFQARTFRSYAGPNGQMLHIAHSMKTIVRRPDRLSVDLTGDDGSIKMRYNGSAIVVYSVEQNQYASLPVTGPIDKALDALEERTGTDFPLADLLSDDPGESVLAGVTSGVQVGTSTIDGVRCRHFFFVQASDIEFELWLEDNERSLPRRFVVTYRSLPGRPLLIADLSSWDLSIEAPDSEFEFSPPAGATKVEFGSQATGTSVPPK